MPRFRAELKLEGKTGTYIEVPLDVPAVFGRARPPVRGTINGAPLPSTIAKYGDEYFLVINRKVREAAGVAAGQTVDIQLELDTKPRTVRVPKTWRQHLTAKRGPRSTGCPTRIAESTSSGSRRRSVRKRGAAESRRP